MDTERKNQILSNATAGGKDNKSLLAKIAVLVVVLLILGVAAYVVKGQLDDRQRQQETNDFNERVDSLSESIEASLQGQAETGADPQNQIEEDQKEIDNRIRQGLPAVD